MIGSGLISTLKCNNERRRSRFQKEGHCSYEPRKFYQPFGTNELASGHAAAYAQNR